MLPIDLCLLLGRNQKYLSAARGRRVEDAGLHLAGQRRVHGQDDELRDVRPQRLHPLVQDLTRRVDLLLARQEHQDVTWEEEEEEEEEEEDNRSHLVLGWNRPNVPLGELHPLVGCTTRYTPGWTVPPVMSLTARVPNS